MRYLLNLIYLLVLLVAAPWLIYQGVRKGKYRAGFAEKVLGRVPIRSGNGPCIWLHAVSVGEVNLLAPLVAQFQARNAGCELVISTTTAAGYAIARQKYVAITVFYAPLDFSWAVAAAMRRVRPSLLVLAELELWPNLIQAAKTHGAKVAIINGRLSANSFRGYSRLRWLVARVLRQVDCIAVQNDEYGQRFLQLGTPPQNLHVTGSIKFDGAKSDRNNPATVRLRELAGIQPDDVVFLVGSTQEPEEQFAIEAFRTLSDSFPQLRLILVPRHPHRFEEVAQLLDGSGISWQRRSLLTNDTAGQGKAVAPRRVLLVDTVGELGAWWGTATIGFVGGSLSTRGGQNMIEPAAYAVATCFGPNTQNFRDVVAMLLSSDGARVVHDQAEMTGFVERCLSDPVAAAEMGHRAAAVVQSQQGATERTFGLLVSLLTPGAPGDGVLGQGVPDPHLRHAAKIARL
ncbi:MAG: 3-deoxy-D-manno-octulosonic acid transferase [Planctomycetota bacterium]|nr:3-deoxy-D-manno-octulosonic acid transferase [Planctomycetota bacterium]